LELHLKGVSENYSPSVGIIYLGDREIINLISAAMMECLDKEQC